MTKKILNGNLSDNEIASGNLSKNKLVIFDIDFKGLESSVSLFVPSMRNALVERYRAETFYKIGLPAQDIIKLLGLETTPIPPKSAFPLFDKMTLEHEPEMYSNWAKLLVAASTDYNITHIEYSEILSKISSKEAKILQETYTLQKNKRGLETLKNCSFKIAKMTDNKLNNKSSNTIGNFNHRDNESLTWLQKQVSPPSYKNLVQLKNAEFPHILIGEKEFFQDNFKYATPDSFIKSRSLLISLNLLKKLSLIDYEYEFITYANNSYAPSWGVVLTEFGYLFVETLEKYNVEDK